MESFKDLKAALPLIEKKLGHTFKNKELWLEAFVHRSYLNENEDDATRHNERLEFLGDTVLGLIASQDLFENHPDATEGELSWIRSRLIESVACAKYTEALELDSFLLMGKGERLNAGKGRASLLADLLEAVLGAVFLDGGIASAEKLVREKLHPLMHAVAQNPEKNYKALIQTYAQRNFHEMPLYRVSEETGPKHEREFVIELIIDNQVLSEGKGASKREAEREAAQKAWEEIERREA